MKAKLEFNLPEDNQDFKLAQRGKDYFCVIWDVLNEIRSYLKYGHQFKSVEECLEVIRDILSEAQIEDIE